VCCYIYAFDAARTIKFSSRYSNMQFYCATLMNRSRLFINTVMEFCPYINLWWWTAELATIQSAPKIPIYFQGQYLRVSRNTIPASLENLHAIVSIVSMGAKIKARRRTHQLADHSLKIKSAVTFTKIIYPHCFVKIYSEF